MTRTRGCNTTANSDTNTNATPLDFSAVKIEGCLLYLLYPPGNILLLKAYHFDHWTTVRTKSVLNS